MACCIFIAWAFRLLIIRPLRALFGRDTIKGDAHQTAPRNVRWVAAPTTPASGGCS
jgi:hypothetical protein